jgi:hypothetical protein
MDSWFASIAAETHLATDALHALQVDGFIVLHGVVPQARLEKLTQRYDQAISGAAPDDIKVGSTTTRVGDFVNLNEEFDDIYLNPPLLQACCRIIGRPFKLNTMHARTLRPRSPAQRLHVDFSSDAQGWPMVGFIVMVDDFTPENGATCFIPVSQGLEAPPASFSLIPACGPAGSMIVYNGSVWHGHGPNHTDTRRRSIQGAYIRRTETPAENLPAHMRPETLARIGALAKYLLKV